MKGALLAVLMLAIATPYSSVCAGKKPDYVYVSGWLVEISVSTHTFTLRHGNKLLQFTTIPSRTNVTVDGRGSLQWSLGAARIGDAVMGKVSLEESRPYLDCVEFTHRPATAIRPKFGLCPDITPYSTAGSNATKGALGGDGGGGKNSKIRLVLEK